MKIVIKAKDIRRSAQLGHVQKPAVLVTPSKKEKQRKTEKKHKKRAPDTEAPNEYRIPFGRGCRSSEVVKSEASCKWVDE